MNYTESMKFIEEAKKLGSILGLDNVRELADKLGNPQDKLNIVHIAGTNGKGSVGAMIASILKCAGLKVGHFSSPYVFEYNEQFKINGENISDERLAEIYSEVKDAVNEMKNHPTSFEIETAAAFTYFMEEKCDIAVIEVGLGGATDATNIIKKPLLSVITHLAMDHMQYLGDTLADIANAKAGIIKEGCPVVSFKQDDEAMHVIESACLEKNAYLTVADKYYDYECALKGSFQKENMACAVEAVKIVFEQLRKLNDVSYDKNLEFKHRNSLSQDNIKNLVNYDKDKEESLIIEGLKTVNWPGRFEKISSNPDFYIDGAHNPDAAIRLRETLNEIGKPVVYIMGVFADKEYEEIADIMFKCGDVVYTVTTPDNNRALDANILAKVLSDKQIYSKACINISEAKQRAKLLATSKNAIIIAFGSLSYLKYIKSDEF